MEVWVLKSETTNRLLPPIDEDGTETFLAWPTQAEAEQGLEHQLELYPDLKEENFKQVKLI